MYKREKDVSRDTVHERERERKRELFRGGSLLQTWFSFIHTRHTTVLTSLKVDFFFFKCWTKKLYFLCEKTFADRFAALSPLIEVCLNRCYCHFATVCISFGRVQVQEEYGLRLSIKCVCTFKIKFTLQIAFWVIKRRSLSWSWSWGRKEAHFCAKNDF